MLKLTDRPWKEFKVGNLFTQKRGKEAAPKQVDKGGKIPVINEIQDNNGLSKFGKGKILLKGNAITVSVNFAQNVFYQKKSFYASVNILVLYSKYLNEFTGEFISTSIRHSNSCYNYAYKTSKDRLNATKILLPVNNDGEPDYKFMEDYIKELMKRKRSEYIEYAKTKLLLMEMMGGVKHQQIQTLRDKKWKEFSIINLFDSIQRGKRLIKDNQTKGMIPYVSSTSLNNGIDNFISYEKSSMRKFNNCLSLANSGSVGSTFYEPFSFVASDHITHLKNKSFNQNTYLFLASLCNRLSKKYNFNREINDTRISREKIMLPVNSDGEPDYKFMEDYISNITYNKYNDYITYAKSQVIKLSSLK